MSLSGCLLTIQKLCTTLSNGCLGFRLDEERGKMRYVMRIAEFSESSTLRTQLAQRLVSTGFLGSACQRQTYISSMPVPSGLAMVRCGLVPFVTASLRLCDGV